MYWVNVVRTAYSVLSLDRRLFRRPDRSLRHLDVLRIGLAARAKAEHRKGNK